VVAGEETASITLGYDAFLGVSLAGTGTALAGVVEGGAAADAGLDAGDTITSLGGTSVTTYVQLQKAVAAHDPGDSVRVTWTDASVPATPPPSPSVEDDAGGGADPVGDHPVDVDDGQ
jgi:S1-C subfamily serine protease